MKSRSGPRAVRGRRRPTRGKFTETTLYRRVLELTDTFNVLDSIPVRIYYKDKDARWVYVNKSYYSDYEKTYGRIFGLKTPKDMIGKTVFDVCLREHAEKMFEDDMWVIKEGKPIVDKLEHFSTPDGAEIYTMTTKVPRFDEKGNITGLIGYSYDVTKTKRAEEELRKGERFLADIFASIQDGISILDEDMNIVRVNSTLERWYAHAMPLVGKKCYAAYHGLSERCEVCPTWQTLQTGEAAYEVVPKRGPEGEIVGWLDLYSFPIIDTTTGQMSGVIEYVRDVTERKQAEEALARERYLMRAFMDNIPDRVYFKDTESRFIRISKAQADAFGLGDPIEAVGKTDFDFFTEEHARLAHEDEQGIIRTGKPLIGIEERETWSGRPDTWVSTSKLPLRDKEGNIVGTFGISRDITDRKRAEEEAMSKRVAAEAAAKVTEAVRMTAEKYRAKIEELEEQIARLKNLRK